MKKKQNHRWKKGVVLSAATANLVALSGCMADEPAINNDSDRTYTESQNLDLGSSVCVIDTLNLSDKIEQTSIAMSELVGELIRNEESAKSFNENPKLFITNFFSTNDQIEKKLALLSFSSADLKMLQALTDPELKALLESNQSNEFLEAAITKGYLPPSVKPLDLSSMRNCFSTPEDFAKFGQYINLLYSSYDFAHMRKYNLQQASWIVAIGVIAWGVVAVEVALWVHAYLWVNGANHVHAQGGQFPHNYIPLMKLWIRTSGIAQVNGSINHSVFERVDYIIENMGQVYPEIDRDAMREVLMTNLQFQNK